MRDQPHDSPASRRQRAHAIEQAKESKENEVTENGGVNTTQQFNSQPQIGINGGLTNRGEGPQGACHQERTALPVSTGLSWLIQEINHPREKAGGMAEGKLTPGVQHRML